MKSNKLFPGVVLILIGLMFMLRNYGFLHFHFWNLFYLWPIIIVIIGINLIFANNRSTWATVLKLGVIVVGFGLLFFGNFSNHNPFWGRYSYHVDDDDDDDDNYSEGRRITKLEGASVFTENYTDSIRVAQLNISGGATTYKLNDTTNQLFSANTQEYFGNYQLTTNKNDSLYVLNFKMRDNSKGRFDWNDGHKKSNIAMFKLNVNPEWDINIATGATDLDFDLSKYKVRKLDLAGGAGAFKIKFGQPLTTTNVDISTGASDVDIDIPNTAACRITRSSAFSSSDFEGFTKVGDGAYETPGFANATNKIYIKIKGGMSSFSVKRY
ncbi:LiaI-LiaF-like domain-containing protein [Mucilaginibacter calamicampi]|uniref:LiaI-LiaF-like domain-containing protein n=1 Tax=Mucilaginibacter calamicampi TaxID=1302352 RepID=A0ABW2YSA8_9SPHI